MLINVFLLINARLAPGRVGGEPLREALGQNGGAGEAGRREGAGRGREGGALLANRCEGRAWHRTRPLCLPPVPAWGGTSRPPFLQWASAIGGRRPMSGGGGRGLAERPGEAYKRHRPVAAAAPGPARPGPALTARRDGGLRRPQHPDAAGSGRVPGAAGARYRFPPCPLPGPLRPGPPPASAGPGDDGPPAVVSPQKPSTVTPRCCPAVRTGRPCGAAPRLGRAVAAAGNGRYRAGGGGPGGGALHRQLGRIRGRTDAPEAWRGRARLLRCVRICQGPTWQAWGGPFCHQGPSCHCVTKPCKVLLSQGAWQAGGPLYQGSIRGARAPVRSHCQTVCGWAGDPPVTRWLDPVRFCHHGLPGRAGGTLLSLGDQIQ